MVMLALMGAVISDCFSQDNTPWMHDSVHRVREVVVVSSSSQVDVIPVQRLKGEQLERLNSHSIADAMPGRLRAVFA